MMTLRALIAGSLMIAAAPAAIAQSTTDQGWISHVEAGAAARPIVLHFRRAVTVPAKPRSFPVRVTADNRFILYVNGARVAAGPSTGDIDHWREESIDLAPYMKAGANIIAATVWNGVQPLKLPANATPQQIAAGRNIRPAMVKDASPSVRQDVVRGRDPATPPIPRPGREPKPQERSRSR